MSLRHIKFFRYYKEWMETWKRHNIRKYTYDKYENVQKWFEENYPNVYLDKMNRTLIQQIVNKYGEDHEINTVKDFLHHIQAPLRDAAYEGWVKKDPTYKVVATSEVKHKVTRKMYLEVAEAERFEQVVQRENNPVADMCDFDLRTGLRFAEVLGLTPADIDFDNHLIKVNKTWDYKAGYNADFAGTKNAFSKRAILIDERAEYDLKKNMFGVMRDEPIFVASITHYKELHGSFTRLNKKSLKKYVPIYNSTVDSLMDEYCQKAKVPRITFHNLRHTHASILITKGVSLQSVAKRLGHADTTTTQKTYVHLLDELKEKDNQKIIRIMDEIGG